MLTPSEQLVQRQLDAYNRHDLDDFLSTYHENVQILKFPTDEIVMSGLEQLRSIYGNLFGEGSTLHAEILGRIVQGNFVIDKERVTGLVKNEIVEAVAIYEIQESLIIRAWFILD